MFLHDDPQAFRATMLSCAGALGMAPVFVAKDYFITLVLGQVAALPEIAAWLRSEGI